MAEARVEIDMAGQDVVIPFQVAPLDVRGRSVQLGPLLDSVLARHNYPDLVSRLLAEAITLTVLLGTALKFDGKFILQTQTDGPVSMLVTDFQTPDAIRAYARYDETALEDMDKNTYDATALLGHGVLAMTIDQGQYSQRYQGIVQLDGIALEEVARRYFKQSEQIPTEIRMAVGESLTRHEGEKPHHSWVAGGVLLQFLPDTQERMRQKDLHGGDGALEDDGFVEDDAWAEAQALMQTIDDVELTDHSLAPEQLLYRLFHEHGVHTFEGRPVQDKCGCSREKVSSVLQNLSNEERKESEEDGAIHVNCEFCSTKYSFSAHDFEQH